MSTPTDASSRRSDLDALRAFAMLLGIVLHAALSFFPSGWPVLDSRQQPFFGIAVSAIHGFRMPLFFVMSGFFSAMLLSRRGRVALLKHRFARVFLPLLLGMITVVPAVNWISGVALASASKKAVIPSTAVEQATDLWAAADAGDLPAIERHLAQGADVNAAQGDFGITPLHRAALANRAAAVTLLVGRGADVNAAATDGGTPLQAAAFVGNTEAVQALIAQGADVNAVDKSGRTALDNAVVDEDTTRYFASMLQLPVKQEGLGASKAAIAGLLREKGAVAGRQPGIAEILMQIPLFNHLWFLWFLWWLVLGYAALSMIGALLPDLRLPSWALLSPARYLWLIPLTMLPQALMGAGGTSVLFGPDTSAGLLPVPHVLAYYAIFFGLGAWYYSADDRAGEVGRRWRITLPIALLVVFPLGMAVSLGWPEPLGRALDAVGPQPRRWLAVGLQAAYPWLMTFGLMGLFRRVCAQPNAALRYLSDSAYWLYLVHLPLVIAAQLLVRDWPIPAIVKLAAIVVVVTAFLLWTYETLVRYTWIGRFLNGPRSRPEPVGVGAGATVK